MKIKTYLAWMGKNKQTNIKPRRFTSHHIIWDFIIYVKCCASMSSSYLMNAYVCIYANESNSIKSVNFIRCTIRSEEKRGQNSSRLGMSLYWQPFLMPACLYQQHAHKYIDVLYV